MQETQDPMYPASTIHQKDCESGNSLNHQWQFPRDEKGIVVDDDHDGGFTDINLPKKVLRPYGVKIITTKPKVDCNLLDYMIDFILTSAMYAASKVFEKRGITFTK